MERCAEITLGDTPPPSPRRKMAKKSAENSRKFQKTPSKIEKSPSENSEKGGLTPAEKYECLTEFGAQILAMFDLEKGCTYLSQNFETITGWRPDEVMGEDFFGIVHSDSRGRIEEALKSDHAAPQRLRCKLRHADDSRQWYAFSFQPREDGSIVAIAENIDSHMQTQHTLQKAKLEAELALRTRSEFLANMSHELRTPLNAVIGFSQIIESQMFGRIDNPQYLDYIKHIQESGYDLLTKIEDLLDIASIDAGRVELAREEVLASDLLRHVIDAQTHHANAAKVTLKADAPEAGLMLYADRRKLQHILGHLVANAIRFSREGDNVVLTAKTLESGELALSVRDCGSGMSEHRLTDITTALNQEHCWTTDSSRSIGLGLALTREFVALHGGKVQVKSQEGLGTAVEITLPKDSIRDVSAATSPEYLLQAAN